MGFIDKVKDALGGGDDQSPEDVVDAVDETVDQAEAAVTPAATPEAATDGGYTSVIVDEPEYTSVVADEPGYTSSLAPVEQAAHENKVEEGQQERREERQERKEARQDAREERQEARQEARAEARAEAAHETYTVKSGDTLSAIGAHFGVDYMDIARLNKIENPDLIYPGQVFKIPGK
jgi:nucleoid-associated protein YgaU